MPFTSATAFGKPQAETTDVSSESNLSILIVATPGPGHVNPLLSIACDLRERGHRVVFQTADVFLDQAEAARLSFVPLEGKANFDYRTFNFFLPEGETPTTGLESMIHDMKHVFGDTMLD